MRVLIACEFSGIVRDAFAHLGHDAWSCDIEPTENPRGQHIQGDVLNILSQEWDLMIAHPPCTYLCNSGIRWLYKDGDINQQRWEKMQEAAAFFKNLLDAPIPKIAIENPIPHRHAVKYIGKQYTQKIQPYDFGTPESKSICLWLKNLSLLQPTKRLNHWNESTWQMSPSVNRRKERSRFFKGVAKAMAEQWGIPNGD